MVSVQEMLTTHPLAKRSEAFTRAIDACVQCSAVCTSCADACLAEEQVQSLKYCIALNLDCASICQTTGEVLLRQVAANKEIVRPMLDACIEACRVCGEECERHASMHDHCRVCAAVCRGCEQICRSLLGSWDGS